MKRGAFLGLLVAALAMPRAALGWRRKVALPFNDPELVRDCLGAAFHGTAIGPTNRGPAMLRLYMDGFCEIRRRANAEPCPHCAGGNRHVYRWLEVKGVAGLPPDNRSYCLCGYAEYPEGGDWAAWREPDAFLERGFRDRDENAWGYRWHHGS